MSDLDGDGTLDIQDLDSDNDGISDAAEHATGLDDYDGTIPVVLDAQGKTVASANVIFTTADGKRYSTMTNESGRYRFVSTPATLLPAGRVIVAAVLPNGASLEEETTILAGRTVEQDLQHDPALAGLSYIDSNDDSLPRTGSSHTVFNGALV